jgi:hypothetical protein
MARRAPVGTTATPQEGITAPSRVTLKLPPAVATVAGPSTQRSVRPPSDASMAPAPGALPRASCTIVKAVRSMGPEAGTP